MDIAIDKLVVIRMTEDEAAELRDQIVAIGFGGDTAIGNLWSLLDDVLS